MAPSRTTNYTLLFSVLILCLNNICTVVCFTHPLRQTIHTRLYLSGDENQNDKPKQRGYKFGDLTKSIIGSRVEKITGKPYEFGDLSRKIDSSIKDSINSLTGHDDYQFGDLSKYVDSQLKQQVNKFTKKDRYQFGDLTREILKRVSEGEYTLDDLFMLLKALALFEASISPVAGFLPVKLLIELLNFSLANDVAGRVSSALAMELDRRLKKAILGDENYVLGDATKRTIANAVSTFTGKDSYSFGDVTKTVVSSIKSNQLEAAKSKKPPLLLGTKLRDDEIEESVREALEKWDSNTSQKDELKECQKKAEEYVAMIEQGE